jgi:hypothetical protein
MNSRQRFLETMGGGRPDHPPLFPEGIREEVLQAWKAQGLPAGARLEDRFHYDDFDELDPDIYPRPGIADWSDRKGALRRLRRRLDPDDPRRLPEDWAVKAREWKDRPHALFLRIHQGLFLSLGVEGWRGFAEAIPLLADEPGFVSEVLAIQAGFASRLAENILREVEVDAVVFSEPIAGNHGPLVSPRMYRELVVPSLDPIFEVLERYRVAVRVWRSYANPGALIPVAAGARFNALWACEAPPEAVDYHHLRGELGLGIGLIGGIDTDILYGEQSDIRRAVEAVLPLVETGRFLPLADGRVREDVPYRNYVFYRSVLEELVGCG